MMRNPVLKEPGKRKSVSNQPVLQLKRTPYLVNSQSKSDFKGVGLLDPSGGYLLQNG